jgi:hypothetical protein
VPDDAAVTLLDLAGRWTYRERHQHHEFPIEVAPGTVELRVRLTWDPLDMGDEHLANSLALTLWQPDGRFRGGAVRRGDANDLRIARTSASPGAIAGPIPAGRWILNLDTGLILPDGRTVGVLEWTVAAEAVVRDERRGELVSAAGEAAGGDPSPTSDAQAVGRDEQTPARGVGWYRGDLHSHTLHSDGSFTVKERLERAVERGLDFLAITDHNTTSHHLELDSLGGRIVPIRGSEVTTFHGHMNVFGLSEVIDWRPERRGGGATGIVEGAHRQGALVSINHPSSFGDPWCVGCHWDFARVDYTTVDAMEIWNGGWADVETANEDNVALWTDLLDAGIRITAITGTDSHGPRDDDDPTLGFSYVHATESTETAILEGIRHGRVYLSGGPTLAFRARGADGADVSVPGATMPAGPIALDVAVDAVDRPSTLWFVTSGGRVALGACAPGATHTTGQDLHPARWWRLELRAGSADNGDLLVLTNPVYVPS